jgi:hypothetical protein
MSLWEKHELTIKKILAIIIAIVVFGYMLREEPEIAEPDIPISYKCEIALRSHDIPEHVKKQCITLLKDKYETEPNQ